MLLVRRIHMSVELFIERGYYIRKGNSFYEVSGVYLPGTHDTRINGRVSTGIINGRSILARDLDGNEAILVGLLTDKKPKDMDPRVDLSDSVMMFVSENPFDLIRDHDLLSINFMGSLRIMEYAEGVSIFDHVFENAEGRIKAIYTTSKNKLDIKAQWISDDFYSSKGCLKVDKAEVK
jgi:hypothetical protein